MATSTLALVHYTDSASIWPQVWATAIVCLGPLGSGIGKGYSSPALASLQDSKMPIVTVSQRDDPLASDYNCSQILGSPQTAKSSLSVTPQEASWIASLSLLGALFGDVVAAVALNLGRRKIMMIIAVPFAISWFATSVAEHVAVICSTSFIGGFCSAILTLGSQIYISEIASPKIRGSLCSLAKIMTNVGMLACFVLGAYLDWRKLAMVAGAVPLLLFILLQHVPESPSFLLYQGKDQASIEALQWLRGHRACVLGELDAIRENLVTGRGDPNIENGDDKEFGGHLWTRYRVLVRPMVITCSMMFLQRCTGAFVLNYYAVVIFQHAVASLSPHSVAILHASVQLGASFVFGLLVDRVGRKPLLVCGNLVIAASLAGLAWSFRTDFPASKFDWVPISCIIAFTVAYSLGIGPIALLLVGELYPLEYRGLGGAVATSFSHACGFVVVKTFVDFQSAMNLSGTFTMYAVLSLAAIVFITVFVPETKGRTLEEIQRRFRRP